MMFSEEWRGILQHFHSHLQSGKVGEGAGTPSRRASEPGGGWASLQQEEGRGSRSWGLEGSLGQPVLGGSRKPEPLGRGYHWPGSQLGLAANSFSECARKPHRGFKPWRGFMWFLDGIP